MPRRSRCTSASRSPEVLADLMIGREDELLVRVRRWADSWVGGFRRPLPGCLDSEREMMERLCRAEFIDRRLRWPKRIPESLEYTTRTPACLPPKKDTAARPRSATGPADQHREEPRDQAPTFRQIEEIIR